MPAHKNNTESFDGLTYAEQASSINSQIMNLKTEILAHRKKAKELDKEDSTEKFLVQLEKLVSDLKSN